MFDSPVLESLFFICDPTVVEVTTAAASPTRESHFRVHSQSLPPFCFPPDDKKRLPALSDSLHRLEDDKNVTEHKALLVKKFFRTASIVLGAAILLAIARARRDATQYSF